MGISFQRGHAPNLCLLFLTKDDIPESLLLVKLLFLLGVQFLNIDYSVDSTSDQPAEMDGVYFIIRDALSYSIHVVSFIISTSPLLRLKMVYHFVFDMIPVLRCAVYFLKRFSLILSV
jgi:hypothetical protein